MHLPTPFPGLVLRYAYLWQAIATKGISHVQKDCPCLVLAVSEQQRDSLTVTVAPIQPFAPPNPAQGVMLPDGTHTRLALEGAQSWVMLTEVNRFIWPGPDLCTVPNTDPPSVVYGVLPPRLFDDIRTQLVENARGKVAKSVRRTHHA